ncbi:Cyclase-like protein 2 [Linum grandiflorum]
MSTTTLFLFPLLLVLACDHGQVLAARRLQQQQPGATVPPAERREVYSNGRLFDITHRVNPNMPTWGSAQGLGQFLTLVASIKNGSGVNAAEIKLVAHTGTHVDAPGHIYQEYYDAGYDVDSLDLDVLNAEVMKALAIPKGTKRVLFRTLNTDRHLMYNKAFDSSFAGFTAAGAQWLVDNTDIKLVGLDYLSVATFDEAVPTHMAFFKNRDIILVEALKLDGVEAGMYNVHCLPMRLLGADGSPARCILIK